MTNKELSLVPNILGFVQKNLTPKGKASWWFEKKLSPKIKPALDEYNLQLDSINTLAANTDKDGSIIKNIIEKRIIFLDTQGVPIKDEQGHLRQISVESQEVLAYTKEGQVELKKEQIKFSKQEALVNDSPFILDKYSWSNLLPIEVKNLEYLLDIKTEYDNLSLVFSNLPEFVEEEWKEEIIQEKQVNENSENQTNEVTMEVVQ